MANQNPTDPQTEKCCHVRNACYQICGATKEFCDAQFDKCSMAVCDAMTSETAKKEQCVKDTELQKTLTKFSGCQVYDQAQGTSCECVMKSKVADSRKQVLQRFYKKFVPDSLHKVDTLAEKADNSKKFAGLLLKLVKKYPDCIKSVQDPKQKLMDDIINGRVNVEDLEHEVLPNKEAVDLDEL